jgi:hypothetical protein
MARKLNHRLLQFAAHIGTLLMLPFGLAAYDDEDLRWLVDLPMWVILLLVPAAVFAAFAVGTALAELL